MILEFAPAQTQIGLFGKFRDTLAGWVTNISSILSTFPDVVQLLSDVSKCKGQTIKKIPRKGFLSFTLVYLSLRCRNYNLN
jgi:hypothetical protein